MFAPRYFAPRYFPRRYFPPAGTSRAAYFPHGYFGRRYYADRYFPGSVTVPTPTGPSGSGSTFPPHEPPVRRPRPIPRLDLAVQGELAGLLAHVRARVYGRSDVIEADVKGLLAAFEDQAIVLAERLTHDPEGD
jgi:hypothetical protein